MQVPCRHLTFIAVALAFTHSSATLFAQGDSGFKYLEVTVVDPEGKPLADVAIDVSVDSMQFPMPTDDEGKISLNVPSGENSRLRLSLKHEGYVALSGYWRGGDKIPEELKVELEKGKPIGGIVHDENGEPIEGVKIEATGPSRASDEVVLQPMLAGELATTDAEGRWQFTTKTDEPQRLMLKLSHPDYVNQGNYRDLATWEELKSLDHVLILEKGIELIGQVTNPDGEPISDAIVFMGKHRYVNDREKRTARTDEQGQFSLTNVSPGSTMVTVAAQGWAPEMRSVAVRREMEPVDFQLAEGNAIKLLVTDIDDEPVEGARIMLEQWRQAQTLPQEIYQGHTDAEGVWESNSLPAEALRFSVYKQGYMQAENTNFSPDGEQHTVVLPWPLAVSGNVVDAESGLPLEKFDIVQGIDWGNVHQQTHWERHNVQQGTNGKYHTEFTYPRAGHLVRIEAEGYKPGISRVIKTNEGEVTINFQLEEGTGPSGTVKNPDGKPLEGAKLHVATSEDGLYFNNGEEQQRRKPSAVTDAKGKYTLPFMDGNYAVVALHDTGWAQLGGEQIEKSADIQLQAWSAVEGTVLAGTELLAEEQIRLYFNQPYVQNAPRIHWSYNTLTDAAGNFKFDRIAGEEAVVARSVRFADRGQQGWHSSYSHSEQVKLKPGETAKVQIGGKGRAIRGQLNVPKGNEQKVAWNMGVVQMSQHTATPANPGGLFHALGRAIAGGSIRSRTPAKQTFRRNYASAIDEEGRFAITDVEPGTYRMSVQLHTVSDGREQYWQPIGTLTEVVTIPETKEPGDGENAQDPHDLGEFTLKMTGNTQ